MIASSANNSLSEILNYGSAEQIMEIRDRLIDATILAEKLEDDYIYDYADFEQKVNDLEYDVSSAEDSMHDAQREAEDAHNTLENIKDDVQSLIDDIRESAGSLDINEIVERLEGLL